MRLDELTAGLSVGVAGAADGATEITGLAYDSRAVARGDLFFCVSGFTSDGHDHAPQALERGAAALVVERPLGLGVPEVRVSSARSAMGPMASRFHGDPSATLRVTGVTGTNGKTTTTYLLRALLEAGGAAQQPEQCGLLGTVKSVVGGQEREVQRTTPEALDLQADLRAMLDGGDVACAIEVSSHALELGRTDGIHFAAALFTNLTQDHLDFHETMEDYFAAKRLLFEPTTGPPPVVSVVNVGDPYGRRLAAELPSAITFAVQRGADAAIDEEGAGADYRAEQLRYGFDGTRFRLRAPSIDREVSLPLPGRFNVENALGALVVAHALGHDLDVLVAALETGVRVPGRFEPVDEGQDFAVIVDYAHTPDSLENVLAAAGDLLAASGGEGRVLCVFGAGGDRDRGKRPLMGEIAARLSDVAFVTSDNPRSEEPATIVAEILAGAATAVEGRGGHGTDVRSVVDRREAIADAVAEARPGDVLVVAGKGHEQGQEFAEGRKLPFDDVTVAREALRDRDGLRERARAGVR